MDLIKTEELKKLTNQYFEIAASHVNKSQDLNETLRKAMSSVALNEEAELPGFETRKIKFGSFENREFVVMMTDIRKSTDIINGDNGLVNMFLIFYIYAGIVANIVDSNNGTSTEFLGDGVLNLFDTKDVGRDEALKHSMQASIDILEARTLILNPFFEKVGLPKINLGIGIDHGITIVTKFGYRSDTDLKAFGKCAYNASRLSKGINECIVSENSKNVWPSGLDGKLFFNQNRIIDGISAFSTTRIN